MLGLLSRQLAWVVLPPALAYGALILISFWLYPAEDRVALDTVEAKETFFGTPPAYVVYDSSRFENDRTSVVLIGPSSVGIGFRPNLMSSVLPGVDIHNISLGGMKIDGMAMAVNTVYASRAPKTRNNLIFVLGLWFNEFSNLESAPGRTPLAQQLERFGLFKKTPKGYRRTLARPVFDAYVTLLRPFFLTHNFLAKKRNPDEKENLGKIRSVQCDRAEREKFLRNDTLDSATYGRAQFPALVRLAADIKGRGGRLVLVDLPHPRCFTDLAPNWKLYQKLKRSPIDSAVQLGAVYLNFQDMNINREFEGPTHPSPVAAKKWSVRLAGELAEIIRRNE